MKDTKTRILNTSKQLFNELGYSQVTIRMIAGELEMSSGNLNYHYKKRDDILEALYFQMVEDFDQRVRSLGDQRISLSLIQTDVTSSMNSMIAYRFFWTDLFNLLKSNTKINTHFINVKTQRKKGYEYLFSELIRQKTMKQESFVNEYQLLAERMINYSNTWMYASSLYDNKLSQAKIIVDQAFQLQLMFYPFLTKRGRRDFEALHCYIKK